MTLAWLLGDAGAGVAACATVAAAARLSWGLLLPRGRRRPEIPIV